jgi:hypothetical protein
MINDMFKANKPDEESLIGVYMHLLFDTSIHTGIFRHYSSYISSHEIIICKDIPLSLCKFIIIHKKDIKTLLERYPHIQVIFNDISDKSYRELLNRN